MTEYRLDGCLPRETKFGKICGAFVDHLAMSEHMKPIPESEWDDIIQAKRAPKLSLRVNKIKDQGRNGSCASESTTQALEIIREIGGLPFIELNPLSMYHYTSGGRDRGSSVDSNLRHARDYGIASEAVRPRSMGFTRKLSKAAIADARKYRIHEFYDVASVAEFGTALLIGYPVVFGWKGHSVAATDLLSTRSFLYVNSWGEDWSGDGMDTLSLMAPQIGQYGAFAIRTSVYA